MLISLQISREFHLFNFVFTDYLHDRVIIHWEILSGNFIHRSYLFRCLSKAFGNRPISTAPRPLQICATQCYGLYFVILARNSDKWLFDGNAESAAPYPLVSICSSSSSLELAKQHVLIMQTEIKSGCTQVEDNIIHSTIFLKCANNRCITKKKKK